MGLNAPKGKFIVFHPSIFRCYNSFNEGIFSQSTIHVGKYAMCPMDGMLNDTHLFFGLQVP